MFGGMYERSRPQRRTIRIPCAFGVPWQQSASTDWPNPITTTANVPHSLGLVPTLMTHLTLYSACPNTYTLEDLTAATSDVGGNKALPSSVHDKAAISLRCPTRGCHG